MASRRTHTPIRAAARASSPLLVRASRPAPSKPSLASSTPNGQARGSHRGGARISPRTPDYHEREATGRPGRTVSWAGCATRLSTGDEKGRQPVALPRRRAKVDRCQRGAGAPEARVSARRTGPALVGRRCRRIRWPLGGSGQYTFEYARSDRGHARDGRALERGCGIAGLLRAGSMRA